MATPIVRKVEDEVARRLKDRAKAAGRSGEAEHRAILEEALRPKITGWDFFRELRGEGPFITDEDIEPINSVGREPHEPMEFPDRPASCSTRTSCPRPTGRFRSPA